MRATMKVWSCVGAFTVLAGGCAREEPVAAAEAAAPQASAPQPGQAPDVFKGDFSGALAKLLEGEGGEAGLGTYFSEGQMVIPGLNGSQIKEAFSDNSLRRSSHFAVHFAADGTMSGWERISENADASLCRPVKDPAYQLDDEGQCKLRKRVPVDGTKWSVRGDKLCTQPALKRIAEGQECFSVFLVLNEVALVAPGDKMIGKGSQLSKGKVLEPLR